MEVSSSRSKYRNISAWQRLRKESSAMTDPPVDLDEHRGMAAQKSTELRRRLHEVQADQTALRRRQDEFERYALAAPSANWPEAAAKARYLIQLFAVTPDAQDPRRQQLIAKVLDELTRLSDQPGSMSGSSETLE
jgi:hypothetical protein